MQYMFQRCRLSQRVRATPPRASTILAMQSLILLLLLAVPLCAHNGVVTIAAPVEVIMNYGKKTKAQLIEELDGLRGVVTDLREKVAGVDVSGVERQLAVERVRAAGHPLG